MPLLDVRTPEKALQYYSDHMHFDVLYLVILSDTRFTQRHKVAVCSYMQGCRYSREVSLSRLATPRLNHTVFASQVF